MKKSKKLPKYFWGSVASMGMDMVGQMIKQGSQGPRNRSYNTEPGSMKAQPNSAGPDQEQMFNSMMGNMGSMFSGAVGGLGPARYGGSFDGGGKSQGPKERPTHWMQAPQPGNLNSVPLFGAAALAAAAPVGATAAGAVRGLPFLTRVGTAAGKHYLSALNTATGGELAGAAGMLGGIGAMEGISQYAKSRNPAPVRPQGNPQFDSMPMKPYGGQSRNWIEAEKGEAIIGGNPIGDTSHQSSFSALIEGNPHGPKSGTPLGLDNSEPPAYVLSDRISKKKGTETRLENFSKTKKGGKKNEITFAGLGRPATIAIDKLEKKQNNGEKLDGPQFASLQYNKEFLESLGKMNDEFVKMEDMKQVQNIMSKYGGMAKYGGLQKYYDGSEVEYTGVDDFGEDMTDGMPYRMGNTWESSIVSPYGDQQAAVNETDETPETKAVTDRYNEVMDYKKKSGVYYSDTSGAAEEYLQDDGYTDLGQREINARARREAYGNPDMERTTVKKVKGPPGENKNLSNAFHGLSSLVPMAMSLRKAEHEDFNRINTPYGAKPTTEKFRPYSANFVGRSPYMINDQKRRLAISNSVAGGNFLLNKQKQDNAIAQGLAAHRSKEAALNAGDHRYTDDINAQNRGRRRTEIAESFSHGFKNFGDIASANQQNDQTWDSVNNLSSNYKYMGKVGKDVYFMGPDGPVKVGE
jgi:hypothetical protein